MTKIELLDGYLDTSGKESNIEDIAIAVTTCLGKPAQWDNFKNEWNEVLKDTPISQEENGNYVFHTTDFWAKKCPPYRDEDGWTQSKRDSIYRSLIEVITKNSVH